MGKIQFVSPSKLVGDAQCPYRQKYQKYEENDILRFGKAVDAGISAWLKGADFQEVFATEAARLNLPLAEYRDRALKCFQTLEFASDDWLNIERENIIAVQSEDGEAEYYGNKFFELPMVDKVWGLRGAMDMIDWYFDDQGRTILRIIDWKTGFSEADSVQLACYALAAWKKYSDFIPWDLIETRFFYLDQGGKSPKTMWDKETLVSAFKNIEERVQTFINRKEWPQKLNKNCAYCSLQDKCEVYKKSLAVAPDVGKIDKTIENLPLILEELEKMNAIKKIAEKAEENLKAMRNELLLPFGKEGTVVDGNLCKITEYTSKYDYDLPTIFNQTQELLQRPPFEIMEFCSGAFDQIIKETKDKVLKKALQQLKKDSRKPKSTSLRFSKKMAATTEPKEEEKQQLAEPKKEIEEAQVVEEAQIEKRFGVCEKCFAISEFHNNDRICRKCNGGLFSNFAVLEFAQDYQKKLQEQKPKKLKHEILDHYGVCSLCAAVSLISKDYQDECQFCKKIPVWWKSSDLNEAKAKQKEITTGAKAQNYIADMQAQGEF